MDLTTRIKQYVEKLTGVRIYRYSLPRGVSFAYDARQIIDPNKVSIVFDIGANCGQSAVDFLVRYPAAEIFCFEPVVSSFLELQSRLSANRKVRLYNFGMGDGPGRKEISLAEDSSVNSFVNIPIDGKRELVEIRSVDDFCLENGLNSIDVLKIDVEGYEIEVLRGAERMLSEGRVGSLYIETAARPCADHYFVPLNAIDSYLAPFGYLIFGIYEQQKDVRRGIDYLYFFNVAYVQAKLCRR